MATDPVAPLRWYELWMLRFLARSPRIHRIVVTQYAPAEPTPTPDPIPPSYLSYTEFLESLYQGPSADE